jgi:transitional endoplasmic reticulum ATPase
MEEPQKTGAGEASTRAGNNRTTSQLGLGAEERGSAPTEQQERPQEAEERVSLPFVVVEGMQVGRGVARIDPRDMERLGCQPGDIIMITGARTTAARVLPGVPSDRGQRLIQMDSQVRQNSDAGLGERVSVHKARVQKAEKITLLPLTRGAPIQESDLQYIARYLVGLPVVIGDLLRINMPGTAMREFLIISTTPATPSYPSRRSMANLHHVEDASLETPPAETSAATVEAVIVQPGTVVRAQARGAGRPGGLGRVSYEDIGGLGKELQRIREMIELPLKYPAVFDRLGVEPPKGVLLYGPPGTGKTLIARAVASETNAAFFVINGPEVINKFYGESESRLREVFQEAQRRAPSIIFIDELDALAPRRAETGGEVERRIVGQLLALMDGMTSRGQVVVIGATNQPNALDPALRRPGRFDREIALRVPDLYGRMEILRIHTRDAALAPDVDFARLAQLTPGFVGADLEALCREAAMIALRRVLPYIDYQSGYIPFETLVSLNITMADFQAALREIEPSTTREVYVEVSETTWDDIGGQQRAKQLLTEGVEWPLRYPEIYSKAKVEPPRGVLLAGPPGSGKTLLARALANQCDASFISIKGPELLSKWVGESEKGVREIFKRAKQAAPCIVFFDEIDALAPRRGGELDAHVGDRVIAQLLTEMDGIEGRAGVIVLAASNRPELVDPALLRPGRFDLIVELDYPSEADRQAIFAVHTRGKPLAPDVDLAELARLTPGRNGADIEAICRRAAMLAMHDWIEPRMQQVGRVQVSEAGADAAAAPPAVPSPGGADAAPFFIRREHFERAIAEQEERYQTQARLEAERLQRAEASKRLLDMVSAYGGDGSGPSGAAAAQQRPLLRGWRLWLARLLGLVPR